MSTRKKTTILVATLLLTLVVFASSSTAQSCIQGDKSVFPEVAQVGDVVTYDICLNNCGDTMLMDIVIEDPQLGLSEYIPILLPGEEWCVSIDYEIQSDDPDPLVNDTSVAGYDETGGFFVFILSATVDLIHPCIDVEKSVFPEVAQVGDIVEYEICVYNCGDTTLMGDILDLTFDFVFLPFELVPGEVWCEYFEYEIQPGDPDPFVNDVLVLGGDEFGNPVEDFDEALVDLVESGTFAIDIKPGSCPNPFNGKSQGSVPVAILGSAAFDVSEVDLDSLLLEGVPIVPKNVSIEDVSAPVGDSADCYDCFDEGIDQTDGYLDLVVKFYTQDLAAAIGPAPRDACVELTLTGLTLSGEPFEASDSMVIKTK